MESNRCSMCPKGEGMCNCAGCKGFFCVKHFIDHRRELVDKFDHDVGVIFNKLLEHINTPKPSNHSSIDLLLHIDRWERAKIEKIQQAAEGARQQLTELIDLKQTGLADQFQTLRDEIDKRRREENFVENDIKRLQEEINQFQRSLKELTQPSEVKVIVRENNEIDWDCLISVEETTSLCLTDILPDATWTQNGITVAGGTIWGHGLNQLFRPLGLYVDDDQTLYIADQCNHRIVKWECGATSGEVVAGGNGDGNRTNQLKYPSDVIVDRQTDSLIICDWGNRRVVRWPRQGGTSGETILDVYSYGLTMDDDGFLYLSDYEKHEVSRWRVGETGGTVVAGGNGQGDRLDQLNSPLYVFVDQDHSVYVSDAKNHRVMMWVKGAKEGIVVAGGQGQGNGLKQLNHPQGVVVDQLGTVYVADYKNHRIMRWPKGATEGDIVIGEETNRLKSPKGLSFDRHGNLYVVEQEDHRVQTFSLDRSSNSCRLM